MLGHRSRGGFPFRPAQFPEELLPPLTRNSDGLKKCKPKPVIKASNSSASLHEEVGCGLCAAEECVMMLSSGSPSSVAASAAGVAKSSGRSPMVMAFLWVEMFVLVETQSLRFVCLPHDLTGAFRVLRDGRFFGGCSFSGAGWESPPSGTGFEFLKQCRGSSCDGFRVITGPSRGGEIPAPREDEMENAWGDFRRIDTADVRVWIDAQCPSSEHGPFTKFRAGALIPV